MDALNWLYPKGVKSEDLATGSAAKSGVSTKEHNNRTKKRADCAAKGKEYDPVTDKCI